MSSDESNYIDGTVADPNAAEDESRKGVGPITNLVLGYGVDGKGDGSAESGLEGVVDKILPGSDKTTGQDDD